MLKALERTLKAVLAFLLNPFVRQNPAAIPPGFNPRRILVIRQHNQLGDMLCVVPLLRSLRQKYPSAEIVLMTSPVNREVMLHNRYIDRIIDYDKRLFVGRWGLKVLPLLRYIRNLRAKRFDVVLVPSTVSFSATSSLLAFLSGAPLRIGVMSIDGKANRSAVFFNRPVRLDWQAEPHRHQTLRNLDVASPLGLSTDDIRSEMSLMDAEVERARVFLREKGMASSSRNRRVAFHPGAGKVPNQWPAERFAALANTLGRNDGVGIFITKGPMDDLPVSDMTLLMEVPFTLIEQLPVREVGAILSLMDLVISNDTGIMHVAAAVGVPVLSLFGPTDPLQWAPLGEKHRFLHSGEDIAQIAVEEVLVNAREMLAV